MDYGHFRRLLETRKSAERADLALLQEFVRDYPYCQTGQLLLAGAMHVQDHVGYDEQLRRTAACVPDRTALFNLIHEVESTSPFVAGTMSPFQFGDDSSITNPQPEVDDSVGNLFSQKYTKAPSGEHAEEPPTADTSHLREYIPSESRPVYEEEIAEEDPHETIRRKLEQLLGGGKEEKEEDTVALPEVPMPATELLVTSKEEDTAPPVSSVPQEPPSDSPPVASKPDEELELLEFSHAHEENFLKELENLPELTETLSKVAVTVGFFDWLSAKKVEGFGAFESIESGDVGIWDASSQPERSVPPADPIGNLSPPMNGDLIDRFIQTEPRIVPQPKAEFFNPSVQAKRSVEEHDDLVSETLAKIYAEQGNLLKARKAYERMRLLHPEKNAYFAALVLKIDNQLNSTTSEDL